MGIRLSEHPHRLLIRLLVLAGLAFLLLAVVASVGGLVGTASASACGANPCVDDDGNRLHYFIERDCGRNPYKYNDISGEWERYFYQWCGMNNHDPFEIIFNNMFYNQVQEALDSVGLGQLSHDEQLKGLIRLGYWREEGYGPGEPRPRMFVVPPQSPGGSPVTVVGPLTPGALSDIPPGPPSTYSSSSSSTTSNADTSTTTTQTQTTTTPTSNPPADGKYTVQGGDTIWGIATRYGISPFALIAANPDIDPTVIVPGQVLNFPTPSEA